MQYQVLRSGTDDHVFLICETDRFHGIPAHVRHQGPWQLISRGDFQHLKLEYRLAIARDRYALVKCEIAVFNPET
jgi:hypothetical protein